MVDSCKIETDVGFNFHGDSELCASLPVLQSVINVISLSVLVGMCPLGSAHVMLKKVHVQNIKHVWLMNKLFHCYSGIL